VIYLLALDPGIRGCGVAIFRDRRLTDCAYVKNPIKTGATIDVSVSMGSKVVSWFLERAGRNFDEVIVEYPRVYQRGGGKSKGDPNDLLPLVAVDAVVVGSPAWVKIRQVFPSDWKGQASKGAVRTRVVARLDAAEMKVLEAGEKEARSLAHNVTDSVGIGLFALGRFERMRVYAGCTEDA
jgi:hypothetical protein